MPVQYAEPTTPTSLASNATAPVTSSNQRASVWQSFCNLATYRQLILIMVNRDLWGRFKGSIFGRMWPIITPFGYLCIYTFVFNVILHVKFTQNESMANFALYFMTGMIPWTAFSDAVSRSTTVILEAPNLVKRVVFPIEVLPFIAVLSGILSQVIAAAVLLSASWIFNALPSWKIIFLPAVLVTQLIFTAGLCWFFAALGVYFRDMKHLMALALSAWMFTTPIAYPESAFPPRLQFMLWLNPMAGIVSDYRRIILEGHMPDWHSYLIYTAMSLVACFLGFAFFYKTQRSFADVM